MSMDQPQPYMSPEGMQPPPPRQGMSTAGKVLLILGIVFLVLILLCCGGLVATTFWARSYAKESFSEDPQVVRQVTAEIGQIDVPEAMRPSFSMNMKIPFSEQRLMTMVAYEDKETQSVLILASFGEAMAAQNREQLRSQMRETLRQRGLEQEKTSEPQETEEREITVRGQPEKFAFIKSKDAKTGKPRLEVSGTFEGKDGINLFQFSGDAEKYDEQKVVKIIESIR